MAPAAAIAIIAVIEKRILFGKEKIEKDFFFSIDQIALELIEKLVEKLSMENRQFMMQ